METLFLLLAQFMLNPTYEKVEYTEKQHQTIVAMVNKSGYLKQCSITGPIGQKPGIIVLGMLCSGKKVYKAKLGIDYKHKLYMRTR